MAAPDQVVSRPTVRYEAQSAPSEGSRHATAAAESQWVGPFERVLGDHDEPGTEKRAAPTPSTLGIGARECQILPTSGKTLAIVQDEAAVDCKRNLNAPSTSAFVKKFSPRRAPPSPQGSRARLSKHVNGETDETPRKFPAAPAQTPLPPTSPYSAPSQFTCDGQTTPDTHSTYTKADVLAQKTQQHLQPQLKRSLASNGSDCSPCSPADAIPPPLVKSRKLISPAAGLRSYGLQESSVKSGSSGSDGLRSCAFPGRAMSVSGPTCLEVSTLSAFGTLNFDDLYLNHAPGMQPIILRNCLPAGQSILVKYESDLDHAVSFMRKRRAGTNNGKFIVLKLGLDWFSD